MCVIFESVCVNFDVFCWNIAIICVIFCLIINNYIMFTYIIYINKPNIQWKPYYNKLA